MNGCFRPGYLDLILRSILTSSIVLSTECVNFSSCACNNNSAGV